MTFIDSCKAVLPQIFVLYFLGIIFFFYLRARKLRAVYKSLENDKRHDRINLKIKIKGVMTIAMVVLFLLLGNENLNISSVDETLNNILTGLIYFMFCMFGLYSGLWLSDDEEFEN
jgi:Na+/H+ antiporter NhaD/arsenite permease-like protein